MILVKLLFVVHAALAGGNGNVVKNGGDYVSCPNATQTDDVYQNQIAVFDIFEGKEYWGHSYKNLAAYRNRDFAESFSKAVRQFFGRSPELQNEILKQFSRFSKNVHFVKSFEDEGIPNFSWTSLMRGCSVKRVAVQSVVPNSPSSNALIDIDTNIWKRMGTDQKIALMVHEYLEAIYFQYVGSCIYSRTQLAVSRLLSDKAKGMSEAEWHSVLRFNCEGNNRPDGSTSADDPW